MKIDLKNKRKKAAIKLIIWFILAGCLFIYLRIQINKIEKRNEEFYSSHYFSVDFNNLKDSLLNNNFNYSFIIVDNGLLLYEGNRNNKLYSGFFKMNNEKKEYSDQEILNKKYKYLLIDNIFKLFENGYQDKTNSFVYENDNIYVKIRVSINNVVNIEVNENNIIYQLEFSNIDNFNVKGSE